MKNLLKLAEELIEALTLGDRWEHIYDEWEDTEADRAEIIKQWDDRNHYVNFTGYDFWTVQHPLTERLNGSLMACKINNDVDMWEWKDAPPMGLFKAWPDSSWSCWDFEPVEEKK